MSGQIVNLKLEAERLSGRSHSLLAIARRLAQYAGDDRTVARQVEAVIASAERLSSAAARLVARPDNLKAEAERLSDSGRDLLEIARQLTPTAAENPSAASEVDDLVRIAEATSASSARLVGL